MNSRLVASLLLLPVISTCQGDDCHLTGVTAVEREAKEKKPPVKLNIDKSRIALLKLLDGDVQKKLEKLTSADEAKRLLEHIRSKGSKDALKNGKAMRFENMKGIDFIGDWALVVDESRFYIVVESQRNVILVKGVFETGGEKEYKALIREVSVGYGK